MTEANLGASEDPTASGPDERAVVAALHSVLASPTFQRAPRAKDLLSFVVTETLRGRGHLLNERVVSRAALGRPRELDTRTDASARVQARRTRELLERHYAGDGRDDPVRITIPTGQYAAAFVPNHRRAPRPTSPSARRTLGPSLTVVELRHRPSGIDRRVAASLSETLVRTLAPFPGLQVVGPVRGGSSPSADIDVLEVVDRTSSDFVLHGGVATADHHVRVTMHLSAGSSGEVRWSETFEDPIERFTGFGAEDDIVARVAATVGDFGSIVFREPLGRRAGEPCVADALRLYYSFLDELTPATAPQVVAALADAAQIDPENAHVLSSLAFTHAVDVLMRGTVAVESMASAEELARRALRLDPTSAVANNVLAIVALAQGQLGRARRHADVALELAPYHPGNAYVAGMVVGASDDWDRGIAIIRRVVRVNPYGPNHRRTLLAIADLIDGDIAAALAESSLLHYPGYIFGPLVRAACLSAMDLDAEACEELAAVCAMCPGFMDDPAAFIGAAPTIPDHAVDHLVGRISELADRCAPQDVAD